jgi:hypothetical protein
MHNRLNVGLKSRQLQQRVHRSPIAGGGRHPQFLLDGRIGNFRVAVSVRALQKNLPVSGGTKVVES